MRDAIEFTKNLFNIDNNTSATVFITLSVTILLQLFIYIYHKLVAFFNRIRERNIFLLILRSNIDALLKVEKIINSIIINSSIDSEIFRYYDLFIIESSLINKLDPKELIEAYTLGCENRICWYYDLRIKALMKSLNIMYEINRRIELDQKYFMNSIENFNRYNDRMNNIIDEISSRIFNLSETSINNTNNYDEKILKLWSNSISNKIKLNSKEVTVLLYETLELISTSRNDKYKELSILISKYIIDQESRSNVFNSLIQQTRSTNHLLRYYRKTLEKSKKIL